MKKSPSKINSALISGGFTAVLLLLGAIGTASYLSLKVMQTNNQLVIHTYEVLSKIAEVKTGLKDAEKGRRGYILTDDQYHLNIYRQGVKETQKSLVQLKQLTLDNPTQQQRLKELQALITKRLATLQHSIEKQQQNPQEQNTQILLTQQGIETISIIEKSLEVMSSDEHNLLQKRTALSKFNLDITNLGIGLGYGISFTLLIIIYYLLQQQIQVRKKAELALAKNNETLKATNNSLSALTTELKRSNQELEQFAYVASHDLQEPLRAVVGYTQLLKQYYQTQLDDTAQEYMNFVYDGATRMQQLIQDLLTYSRIGTKGNAFTVVDCNAVVEEAMKNLHSAITESNVEIIYDTLPNLEGDFRQLIQLFQNLLSNAIKFRRQNSPIIIIKAELKFQDWLFSITDNGIGMKPQYLEKIFIIFKRLHTRREYPGTGIGLAICKKIVERHGGQIWAESELNIGTTFFFTIPLK